MPKKRITALRAHVLAHVCIIVFTVATQHVLEGVIHLAWGHVKIIVNTPAPVLVRDLVLVRHRDHIIVAEIPHPVPQDLLVLNAKVHVLLPVKMGVKPLAKVDVKQRATILVKVTANQVALEDAIKAAKTPAIVGVKGVVIQDARTRVIVVVKAHAKQDVRVARVLVIQGAICHVLALVRAAV